MIQLKVNGAARQFDGDPEMPLLWYLRDVLEMTGTKYGCGMGLCGACTVHLDGTSRHARPSICCFRLVAAGTGSHWLLPPYSIGPPSIAYNLGSHGR